MTKIFVSNFDWSTTLARIADLFENYGEVTSARLRYSKGRKYAIVEMPDDSDANEAIRGLDGKEFRAATAFRLKSQAGELGGR
jgi:RNA recognition motif-containing protein